MSTPARSLAASRWLVTLCYVVATLAGFAAIRVGLTDDPLLNGMWADVVATIVVFGFSFAYGNSSFYDAYWSVAPPLLGVYWLTEAAPDASLARAALALGLCTVWGVRLTYNWARGWTGLHHEDWRYVDLRETSGRAYWLVSFFGLHFFPTFQVFAGCVGLYYAIVAGPHALGLVDAAAVFVTVVAIAVETVADEQLRAFVARPGKPAGAVMQEGLWKYSRHPNYFGEMAFWWGMFLFGYAAAPEELGLLLVGPVAITVMFFFVSVPMMEKRQLARKPAFADVVASTSMIIPWFPKRTS